MTSCAPSGPLYADDLPPGTVYDLGHYAVTEAEVVEFGRRWDLLPIHTDPEAAAKGAFGGLIASGVHTLAMSQNLMSRNFISHLAIVAGKGIRSMDLEHPVRPGDRLRGSVEIIAVDKRGSRADLTTRVWMVNQNGLRVLDMTAVAVVLHRTI